MAGGLSRVPPPRKAADHEFVRLSGFEPCAFRPRPIVVTPESRAVMFKSFTAITIAAAIAAAITVFTAPADNLAAGPLAKPDEATLKACVQRPWPYLNCVGTRVGNPNIRLIATDRLGH